TRITFTGQFDHAAHNRMSLALMTSILDMRLREVLREDMGGTYGASVSSSTQWFPDGRYSISIAFGAAPDRIEELTAAVFAEIERLKAEGPAADALASVKEQQRRGFETGLQRNQFWLSALLREAETGEPAAVALELPALLERVSAGDVQAAARQWLDLDNYVRVTLLPTDSP